MSAYKPDQDRIRNALWGLFVADALAMPAHWYYSLANIKRDFGGGITGFVDPPHPHPEAFMVGMSYRPDLDTAKQLQRPYDILHDHVRFYDTTYAPLGIKLSERESEHGNAVAAEKERYHYHHGLTAGDNTVAAHLVRVLLRTVAAHGEYRQDAFLDAFVEHLTTPGRNRDPYLEIYIRHWFQNWTSGVPAYASADYQRRVWSIGSHGGLMRPMVVGLLPPSDFQALGVAIEHHNLTHRSENNVSALSVLVPLLRALVSGEHPTEATPRFARAIRVPRVTGEELYEKYRSHGGPGGIPPDEMWRLHTELAEDSFDLEALVRDVTPDRVARALLANACYPEHGVPLLLYHAMANGFDPTDSLLANANAGGDNVHRGMVLGLLVGAAAPIPDTLKTGLTEYEGIAREIEAFVTTLPA
ncbi:MAG: ADP-ribosylglycohydrolase family protein [Spirochaetaceae bacterium]|nr:MAG: ADP-ribosylglycohydrolase family protein [Spirochaetaceae bacterium]